MNTHPNSQPSMQSLLHSSPSGDDQDILHRQSSGIYIPTNDHPYNAWTTFNAHSPSSLEQKVELWGQLRLPPATAMDNSSSMSRFMTDETSSRPLIELEANSLSGINNRFPSHNHNPHLSIATSWNGYQSPYHESADASSAVSSIYEYNPYTAAGTASTSGWTGSPDGLQELDFNLGNTSPTSPRYIPGPIRGGRGGHPSMAGCLSLSSPGAQRTWRRSSEYSSASNSGNNSPGEAPEAIGTEVCLTSQGSYVNLKSIQLAPAEDERDEERDDLEAEEDRPNPNSIPDIQFHGPEHDTNHWCNGKGQYYMQTPMEVECSTPSSCPSPPKSPPRSTLLEASQERRRRSGSGASQLSAKGRAELMKPYKDTFTVSKTHKGRGAGKKHKERQCCPEHPTKSFRHNSDFRKHMQTQHTRPFLCTFYFANCTQTFGSKNEWKRHVFSQHLQLHYWRCDNAGCAERRAFFNRKDLFGQHLKRMHGPNTSTPKGPREMKDWLGREIPLIQERCRKERRSPPEWSKCGYCLEEFKGEGSWDLRMEHVGKHYEKNNYKNIDPKAWVMDEGLVEWAIGVGIVEKMECGNHKLVCSGKDSIEGEEKKKSQMEQTGVFSDDGDDGDGDGDAEGEYI